MPYRPTLQQANSDQPQTIQDKNLSHYVQYSLIRIKQTGFERYCHLAASGNRKRLAATSSPLGVEELALTAVSLSHVVEATAKIRINVLSHNK
jgi:hypothetical protein